MGQLMTKVLAEPPPPASAYGPVVSLSLTADSPVFWEGFWWNWETGIPGSPVEGAIQTSVKMVGVLCLSLFQIISLNSTEWNP